MTTHQSQNGVLYASQPCSATGPLSQLHVSAFFLTLLMNMAFFFISSLFSHLFKTHSPLECDPSELYTYPSVTHFLLLVYILSSPPPFTHTSLFLDTSFLRIKMETPTCLSLALVLLLCFSISAESVIYRGGQTLTGDNGGEGTWCIAKPSASNGKLSQNIEYSCKQNGVNCGPIQPGGNCFHPNNLISHASYTMNLFYKAAGKHTWDCHFGGTGMIVTQDPSYGSCSYPL